jgi:glycosyltransferase involved in cell wall biosynthesis
MPGEHSNTTGDLISSRDLEDRDRDSEVSVVVPTFNRAGRLREALQSVMCQTYRDFEVIIVDDCSSDETAKVVEATGHPRLRYLRHDQNLGAPAARNTGIAAAVGKYIAFLDDDDLWFPRKLEKQVAALCSSSSRVGVVSCSYLIVSDISGTVVREDPSSTHPDTPQGFLRATGFMTSIPLVRKRCFETEGLFDVDLPGCQDKDMWIRIARRYSFTRIPEVLAEHHIHGCQISTELESKIRAKQMLMEKHRDIFEECPEVLAQYLERIGILYCAAGSPEKGRPYLQESIRQAPGRESALQHLQLSRSDPEMHRRHLIDEVLLSIDGVTLYY